MNKDALIEAIANIDDEYILDAHAEASKTKRRARIIKIAAVAAAVCVMGAAIIVPAALRGRKPVEPKYKSFITDSSLSIGSSIESDLKRDWWSQRITNNDVSPDVITYTYDGVEYEVKYSYSHLKVGDLGYTNVYTNNDVDIYLWADTNEFKAINFNLYSKEYRLKPKIDSAREFAIEYARDLASKYIDLSKYKMDVYVQDINEFSRKENETTESYQVNFTKYIDGHETIEGVKTTITAQGDLAYFGVDCIGLFDDFDRELPTKEEVNESINATLDAIFKDTVYEKYKCEIKEINRQMLTYSPDGDLVILTSASMKLSKKGCQDVNTAFTFATVIE